MSQAQGLAFIGFLLIGGFCLYLAGIAVFGFIRDIAHHVRGYPDPKREVPRPFAKIVREKRM